MCDNLSDAHNPDSFGLPFLPQPFCPSENVRRQHTRDRLAKQSNSKNASLRTGTVVGNMKIVGKKLHVRSEVLPSRTHCRRLAAFDSELRLSPCTGHSDSAAKFDNCSTVHASLLTANANNLCNCYDDDESCNCRSADERPSFVNNHKSICQPCPICQQQEQFPNELDQTDEYHQTGGVEPEISHNSAGTYCNARIDQNRLLKLLRRFDVIRQRAQAAREACLLRFEMRQKQRLRLFDLTDSDYQQKDASQDVLGNDKNLPPLENDGLATAAAMSNDIGVRDVRTGDVKLREIIDACSPPARPNNFVNTWPPLLDDETTSIEPTDAVISRLMSQFENIRLNGVTARLENQKRFENKRKQRKYITQILKENNGT